MIYLYRQTFNSLNSDVGHHYQHTLLKRAEPSLRLIASRITAADGRDWRYTVCARLRIASRYGRQGVVRYGTRAAPGRGSAAGRTATRYDPGTRPGQPSRQPLCPAGPL